MICWHASWLDQDQLAFRRTDVQVNVAPVAILPQIWLQCRASQLFVLFPGHPWFVLQGMMNRNHSVAEEQSSLPIFHGASAANPLAIHQRQYRTRYHPSRPRATASATRVIPLLGRQVGALREEELQPTPTNRTPAAGPRTCPLYDFDAIKFASFCAMV